MTSKNGSKELVSLLQYMKNTSLDNPEVCVKDERIVDKIVSEVKESEEWEAVQMNILEVGINKGEKQKLISIVCKKLKKGYSPNEIAEFLEEDITVINQICEIAQKYAPEYEEKKVFQEMEHLIINQ